MNIFSTINELHHGLYRFALCTVVQVSGSTPRKVGAKMLVIDNDTSRGAIKGTIGGGAIEHHIREQALEVVRNAHPRLVKTSLRNELGMCCGGEMTVFIEPIIRPPTLICFGAGHIAQHVCPLADNVGFDVVVVDERAELLTAQAFAIASNRYSDTTQFVFDQLPFSATTYVVIATHDHDLDQKMVELVLKRDFAYAALVGSQRKALMTQKRLRAKGYAEQVINRIECPAGLFIGAQTPEEIAVSIVAQMIKVRHEPTTNRDANRSGGIELAHGIS